MRGNKVIVIGGSTSSPKIMLELLRQVRSLDPFAVVPPIVLALHISNNFTPTFCNQVRDATGEDVFICHNGIKLKSNAIYIVPKTDRECCYVFGESGLSLNVVKANPLFAKYRPSIDSLFSSSVRCFKSQVLLLLPGIGEDGTEGLSDSSINTSIYILSPSQSTVNGMLESAIKKGVGEVLDIAALKDAFILELKGL